MKENDRAPRMTRPRWPLLALLLAALLAAALYMGLGALWLPVLLGALLAVTDGAVFGHLFRQIRVLQTLSAADCVTGDALTLELQVRAPATLALCLAEQRRAAQTYFPGRPPELLWQPLPALKDESALRAADVGPQRAGVSELRVFSPLGLFSRRVKLGTLRCEGPQPVLVLPRLHRIGEPPAPPAADQGQRDRRTLRTGELDGVSGNRDYVEGEPLSRVNWKLTAARRSLYIKEFDNTGLRQDSVLYVAPFPPAQRKNALEAALAGGALLLRGNDLSLLCGGTRTVVRKGDLTALARALALCPDGGAGDEAQNEMLAALAAERSCCAVLTGGDEETCRLLGTLPQGSLAFCLGASGWSNPALKACRARGVNLCRERVGEEWLWLRG